MTPPTCTGRPRASAKCIHRRSTTSAARSLGPSSNAIRRSSTGSCGSRAESPSRGSSITVGTASPPCTSDGSAAAHLKPLAPHVLHICRRSGSKAELLAISERYGRRDVRSAVEGKRPSMDLKSARADLTSRRGAGRLRRGVGWCATVAARGTSRRRDKECRPCDRHRTAFPRRPARGFRRASCSRFRESAV